MLLVHTQLVPRQLTPRQLTPRQLTPWGQLTIDPPTIDPPTIKLLFVITAPQLHITKPATNRHLKSGTLGVSSRLVTTF